MFNKIKSFFEGATSLEVDKSGKATDKDLQIATAVLLLEMSGSDEDYAPEEIDTCFVTMRHQFKIEDEELLSLFEEADELRKEKGRIDEFVNAINDNFSDKQKQLIMAMIWRVILADDIVDKFETRFATQLRTRLMLSREQAEEAKRLVVEGRV